MDLRLDICNWPPVYIGARKRWASGQTLTTSLLFTFHETGDRWAPGYIFTTSLLFAL